MARPPVADVTALAQDQHGLVSLAQLRSLGVSRQQLRTMVAAGWLERDAPAVYAIAGAPAGLDRTTMSGLLVLGPSAVVSHEGAARLHGFDRALPDAVEFTVPRAARRTGPGLRVHTSSLGPFDSIRVGGFPCTSATRTILDLAQVGVSPVRLEAAIDSAVRSGATAPTVLAARLAERRGPGYRGTICLEELLPDSGGHTALERRFLRLVREAGLARPRTQVVHARRGRTFARVDFLFDAHGVVVEVSGRRGHASDAERARDAQRRNELQDAGRIVYEYTSREVFDHGDRVIATLAIRLASRSRLEGAP